MLGQGERSFFIHVEVEGGVKFRRFGLYLA